MRNFLCSFSYCWVRVPALALLNLFFETGSNESLTFYQIMFSNRFNVFEYIKNILTPALFLMSFIIVLIHSFGIKNLC